MGKPVGECPSARARATRAAVEPRQVGLSEHGIGWPAGSLPRCPSGLGGVRGWEATGTDEHADTAHEGGAPSAGVGDHQYGVSRGWPEHESVCRHLRRGSLRLPLDLNPASVPDLHQRPCGIGLQNARSQGRPLIGWVVDLDCVGHALSRCCDHKRFPGGLPGCDRRGQPQHRSERMGSDDRVAACQEPTEPRHHCRHVGQGNGHLRKLWEREGGPGQTRERHRRQLDGRERHRRQTPRRQPTEPLVEPWAAGVEFVEDLPVRVGGGRRLVGDRHDLNDAAGQRLGPAKSPQFHGLECHLVDTLLGRQRKLKIDSSKWCGEATPDGRGTSWRREGHQLRRLGIDGRVLTSRRQS